MIESGINVFLELPVPDMVSIAVEAEQIGYSKC